MDSQPWDKAKLEEWKNFWESEMGKVAISKMENLKAQCLDASMKTDDLDRMSYYVGRAGGAEMILEDIRAGIRAATEAKKNAT